MNRGSVRARCDDGKGVVVSAPDSGRILDARCDRSVRVGRRARPYCGQTCRPAEHGATALHRLAFARHRSRYNVSSYRRGILAFFGFVLLIIPENA
jgi:hypothetical protein